MTQYDTVQHRQKFTAYMDVNVLVYHSSPINALNDRSGTGIFQDGSGHVKLLVKRADDEVAVQHVIASRVDQS